MIQFCTKINHYEPDDDESDDDEPDEDQVEEPLLILHGQEPPLLQLRDVEDHREREYMAWLVGTTANGHPFCRRFLSKSFFARDMTIYHVTPELIIEARWWRHFGQINPYGHRAAAERARDPAAYARMLEA
jgi:hypothetical protein